MTSDSLQQGKIGFFDSGFGGLTILRDVVAKLPNYSYIYLGDTARAPYGTRNEEEILEFTKQGIDFLFSYGAEIIVLACNTASSEALRKIQQQYLPEKYPDKKVLGVVIPTCEDAAHLTNNKKIGVLATVATVRSGSFKRELQKIDSEIEVFEMPAPRLVPIVEEGKDATAEAEEAVKGYVEEISKNDIDTLILGCTHYGVLKDFAEKYAGVLKVVSESAIVAEKLSKYLERHVEIEQRLKKETRREFFTTGEKEKFDQFGSRFFGEEIKSEKVSLI